MSKLTLQDILNLNPEEILAKANKNPVFDEELEFVAEEKIKIEFNHYNGLLPLKDIQEDLIFSLKNGWEVKILSVNAPNNTVHVCFLKYPFSVCPLNLYKLSEESLDGTTFPYKIGEEYLYCKNKKVAGIPIKIALLNPSQNAVGFFNERGKKVYVKVSKLRPVIDTDMEEENQ